MRPDWCERDHQELHDGFFERVLGRHRFEVADHVGVAALCDAGLGQRAPRQQVAPFETAGLDLDEGFVAEVGERTTPPEPQRLLEQRLTRGRIPRQRISREVHETIELVHVDVGGFEVEHVPGRRGRDQRALIGAVGLQQAAQLRDLIRNGPHTRVGLCRHPRRRPTNDPPTPLRLHGERDRRARPAGGEP